MNSDDDAVTEADLQEARERWANAKHTAVVQELFARPVYGPGFRGDVPLDPGGGKMLCRLLTKGRDDSGHEHAPAGSSTGGQFVSQGGGSGDKPKKPKEPKEKPEAKEKPQPPGSQMPDEQKAQLRAAGMVGTFPPANVPLSSIKVADLSRDKESLAYEPLMSWNQTTKSGRVSRQYRYTQEFHDRNAASKFERVEAIEPHIEKIADALTARMNDATLPVRQREAAAIASVIRETGLRPTDGDESVKHGHFGISSLQAKHAKIEGDEVHFDFIGKEGMRNQTIVKEPGNVAFLKEALEGKQGEQPIFAVATSDNAGDVLKAVSKDMGGPEDIKVKDLRTLKATQTARQVVQSFAGPPPPLTGNAKKDGQVIARAILTMSGAVAKVLCNTPQQAKMNYIHPEIFKQWQSALSTTS